MALTDEARARLAPQAAEIIGRYPKTRSALLPLLHLVQSEEGYVSRDGITFCASQLGLSEADVTGVVSFYTMYKRRPIGEYHVGVCTTALCAVMGGDAIFADLQEHLGIGNDETTADGKRVPNVPDWRAKLGFTYRPDENWAYTMAVRYSGKQFSTLDNTDVVSHVFGAFDYFTVVDMKIHYKATEHFAFDFGIDNLLNQQYFLFHPFPGRTYVLAAKYTF